MSRWSLAFYVATRRGPVFAATITVVRIRQFLPILEVSLAAHRSDCDCVSNGDGRLTEESPGRRHSIMAQRLCRPTPFGKYGLTTGGKLFEDVHVELLPARTTMQTVVGAGGPGGNGGAGGNALAIANSGVLIIIDHSTVGMLNVTNTDTGPATAAATGGAGGEGGNGGTGVLSTLSLHPAPAVPVDQAVSADPGAHSSPPVPADPPVPAAPAVHVDQAVSADPRGR